MDTNSLVTIAVTVGIIAVFWYLKRPDITGAAARALLADGARLIDVRSAAEFNAGHLKGARNVPVGEIRHRAGELGDKSRPVILYCASGARSAMAKRTLQSAGFTKVYNLGAMANW